MKLFNAGVSHKTAPVARGLDRLSTEEKNHCGVSDPFATSSNLLPAAA
jgi:hypothetical protein